MIVNQKKNASFRSTLEYVLGKEKSTLIDTNMGGETPRQLAAEFAAARRHRPNLKRACGHIIISIPYRNADHLKGEYHEHLDDKQYVAIAHRWLIGMEFLGEGLSCSQYLIARHHDTDHEHIHIIASRIRMDGSVVSDSWDYRRSEVIVRQLEKQFNLEPTPCSNWRVAQKVEEKGISTTVSDRSAPTRRQKHYDSDKPTVKQRLASLIDEACSDSPTVTQLIGRLQHQGVIVHPQFSTKGLFKEALAFELDGVKVAGNKLGSAYSFPGLLRKRGVQYDPERDNPALLATKSGEVVALKEPSPLASTFEPPIQHQKKEPPPIEADTQPAVVFQPTRVEQAEDLPTKLDILKVEWDSQRRWVSIASDDPNYPINQAAFKEQPEIKPEPLVEKEQSQEKKPTPTRWDSRPTEEQQQQAEYIYHIAWQRFQQAKLESKIKPLVSGGGGSYFEDKDYFFALNERDNRFAVVHYQRGLLDARTIEPVDIEAFGSYSKLLPSSQKPPQSQQKPQLELD
ncbi:MAG TPA: relaxase/mobilization nuclease domain-containing protein [Coleofasciculaceae cyanobacterium]